MALPTTALSSKRRVISQTARWRRVQPTCCGAMRLMPISTRSSAFDSTSITKVSDRQWLAFGVQGLAPYWFELDVTAYVGDDGRTALSAEAEYELLLTQRLILQPRAGTESVWQG